MNDLGLGHHALYTYRTQWGNWFQAPTPQNPQEPESIVLFDTRTALYAIGDVKSVFSLMDRIPEVRSNGLLLDNWNLVFSLLRVDCFLHSISRHDTALIRQLDCRLIDARPSSPTGHWKSDS